MLLAAVASLLGAVAPAVTALLWAMVLGVVARPWVQTIAGSAAGIQFAASALLRAGVALLGLRVSLDQLASMGLSALTVVLATMVVTFGATVWIARRLKVGSDLGILIAAGTAICGASAIIAVNAVVRAREDATSYAIATVTVFGAVAMLLIPLAGEHLLQLTPTEIGIWAGASIHEVAQVTVAGAAVSALALETATLLKLGRVAMLAPLVALIGRLSTRLEPPGVPASGPVPLVPGFLAVFIVLVLVRTVFPLDPGLIEASSHLSTGLLTVALVGLGMGIDLPRLRDHGLEPLALGLTSGLIAAGVALALVLIMPA